MASFTRYTRWIYGIAGSGLAASFFSVLKPHIIDDEQKPNDIESYKWNPNWDRRDVSSLIKPNRRKRAVDEEKINQKRNNLMPTATRHILMIRHGQYNFGPSVDEEMKLTLLGRQQASVVGKRLKDLKLGYTKLIRSTLTRAIETSDIIHQFIPDVPLETTELLTEGHPIPCEPKVGNWQAEYEYYQDGPRIEAAFRKYFHRAPASQKADSYEVMVCHANVIRYFVCRLLQVPPEAWLRFSLHHCSITWAVIYPNGCVSLQAYGDCGFIPLDKMSRRNVETVS